MIGNLLKNLTFTDWLALGIGLVLGVSVIFVIRSRQAWQYRRAYGYNVYAAEGQRRKLLRWAGFALVCVIVIAAIYAWQVIRSGSTASVSPAPSQEEGEPFAGMMLIIPKLGIEARVIEAPVVAQQWDISMLTDEVAHLAGTAYPAQPGNAVLAGHITVPGAGWGPFKDLGTLQTGNQVFVKTDAGTFTYEVVEQRAVDADAVEVVFPTDDTRLTLLTCTGWDGDLQHYTQRIVIIARLAP